MIEAYGDSADESVSNLGDTELVIGLNGYSVSSVEIDAVVEK